MLNTNDESVLPLKRRGLIARYVSTEATFYDDDLKDKEGYWHAAYVIPWFLGYNTKMVKKDEVPKNYEELLNPQVEGPKNRTRYGQWKPGTFRFDQSLG